MDYYDQYDLNQQFELLQQFDRLPPKLLEATKTVTIEQFKAVKSTSVVEFVHEVQSDDEYLKVKQQILASVVAPSEIPVKTQKLKDKFKIEAKNAQEALEKYQKIQPLITEKELAAHRAKLLMDIPLDCVTDIPIGNLFLCAINPKQRLAKDFSFQLTVLAFVKLNGSVINLVKLCLDFYKNPDPSVSLQTKTGTLNFLKYILECSYVQENPWRHYLNKQFLTNEQLREELIPETDDRLQYIKFDAKHERVASQITLHMDRAFKQINFYKIFAGLDQTEQLKKYELCRYQLQKTVSQKIKTQSDFAFYLSVVSQLLNMKNFEGAIIVQNALKMQKMSIAEEALRLNMNLRQYIDAQLIETKAKEELKWPRIPIFENFIKEIETCREYGSTCSVTAENMKMNNIEVEKVRWMDGIARYCQKQYTYKWDPIDAEYW
ncbi:Conserved_hypothetical protein [Hexamita inflata]|uniref:Uncharacterized protein n=1 Tax=Hexamita inflata TaxID=28002 RepID=A0AA86UQ65_9EUKA|nr:Conserved hypothetical protein [Hexamita inflata]